MLWIAGAICVAAFILAAAIGDLTKEIRQSRNEIVRALVPLSFDGHQSSVAGEIAATREHMKHADWRLDREERVLEGDWLEKMRRAVEANEAAKADQPHP